MDLTQTDIAKTVLGVAGTVALIGVAGLALLPRLWETIHSPSLIWLASTGVLLPMYVAAIGLLLLLFEYLSAATVAIAIAAGLEPFLFTIVSFIGFRTRQMQKEADL